MKKLCLIACALTIVNAGYIGNNEVYTFPNSYVQSGVKGGTEDYSFAQSLSYAPSGPYSAQSSGTTGYVSASRGSKGDQHVPIIKGGVPIDTPEVQKARAEHFALYAQAAAAAAKATAADEKHRHNSGHQQYQPKYTQTNYPGTTGHYNSEYNYQHPSSNPAPPHIQSGPHDTTEIQQSKAVYFNTFIEATPHSPQRDVHYRQRRGLEYSQFPHDLYSSQPQHIPVITKEGVPVETPEVQAAKAQHFLAHATAKSGHKLWKQDQESYEHNSGWANYEIPQGNQIEYTVTHETTYHQIPYQGPQHIPQLDQNGVPVETPEVQAAKQQHFQAHAEAKLKNLSEGWQQGLSVYNYAHRYSGSLGSSISHQGVHITSSGVPEETPEVKIAKARHLIAHAQEKAKHAQWAGQSRFAYGSGSYLHH